MQKPVISKPAELGSNIKVLVHGPSGAGKTRFASTFPSPIIFDIEGGSMSIDSDKDVAIVARDQITLDSLQKFADWLSTPDAKDYKTVVVDSLTELQSQFLEVALQKVPDPRMAYGQWQNYLRTFMTKLFNLNKNVVVICRSKMGEDIEGAEKLFPELAPSAFTVLPALVDFAVVVTGKTTGIGANAKTQQLGFHEHPKYWTKARAKVSAPQWALDYDTFKGTIQK